MCEQCENRMTTTNVKNNASPAIFTIFNSDEIMMLKVMAKYHLDEIKKWKKREKEVEELGKIINSNK